MSYRVDRDYIGTWQTSTGPRSVAIGQLVGMNAPPADPWSNKDELKLLSNLQKAVEGHTFNAAVFLGEAKESLEMITNTARSLAQAIWYVKRGNFDAALRHFRLKHRPPHMDASKTFAHNWLQLKYGWMPLVSDAREAAIALAAITNRPAKFAVNASRSAFVGLVSSNSIRSVTVTVMQRKRYKYYLTEDYSPMSGLGFTDPLPVAWELIPYSFVVDWFLPVGSYLEGRAIANRLKGSYVLSSRRQEKHFNLKVGTGYNIPDAKFYQDLIYTDIGSFTRTVGSGGLPLPNYPELVPLKEALTWSRAISAVSLLVQRFHAPVSKAIREAQAGPETE
jgi:hypothetical protein